MNEYTREIAVPECKFCTFEKDEDGEIWDVWNPIEADLQPFGKGAEVLTEIRLRAPIDEKGYALDVDVNINNQLDLTIGALTIPIKFCPFCGRSFADETTYISRISDEDKWVPLPVLARILDVHPYTIQRWVGKGKLTAHRMVPEDTGRSTFCFTIAELERNLDAKRELQLSRMRNVPYYIAKGKRLVKATKGEI